jgi:acetate kinase
MRILVVNAGSSSLKLSLVSEPDGVLLGHEELDRGTDATRHAGGDTDLDDALARLEAAGAEVVGYRVVHGGRRRDPTPVDDPLLDELMALDELAPLHNRVAVAAIRDLRERLPELAHVACFDTAFHATLPEAAWRYALPAEWIERFGIRRYGFHGLSVAWAVGRAGELLRRPAGELGLVVAHLGSGASVTAVQHGAAVATSMGMTPLEGLVMGTRAGSVDPGILIHLLRHGVGIDELADGLGHRGGLVALAGRGAGMRELEAAAGRGDASAQLAIEVFVVRAAAEIAASATALSRLDALVFTGGIGEHSSLARAGICRRLGVIGVPDRLAEPSPAGSDVVVAEHDGRSVLVVGSREDRVIARLVAGSVTKRPD